MNKGQVRLGGRKKRIPKLQPEDILRDGHWEPRGAIRVWVSHECEDCGDIVPQGQRCDTCLTWAVKNARDFEWARMSRQNRGVVWTILAARKNKELTAA